MDVCVLKGKGRGGSRACVCVCPGSSSSNTHECELTHTRVSTRAAPPTAHVSVPARLRERVPHEEQPRPHHEALVDRLSQAVVSATCGG
jgi:hypothetical protein